MRALVILVAVSCCSAQLVLPYANPWALQSAKLITTPAVEGDVKPVALASPYINPFGHPLATPYANYPFASPYAHHPFATPYAHHPFATPYTHPFGYAVKADTTTLKATEFPHIFEEVKAEEAVESARRRRSVVSVPLPYIHAVPTVAKTTVETKQFEAIEAATPADTTKIELTTKEHEINVPAIKYVQPVANYKPITYTAVSPAVLPYQYPITYGAVPPITYGALPFPFAHAPVTKLEE